MSFEDNFFKSPDRNAVAVRDAIMVIRMKRTGKWHIAFVPKGVRFSDSSQVHIFKEYEYPDRDTARSELRRVYEEVHRKIEALRENAKPLDKKS